MCSVENNIHMGGAKRGDIVTWLIVLCTCINECVAFNDVTREKDANTIMDDFVVSRDS
jgi:hypothetical protein